MKDTRLLISVHLPKPIVLNSSKLGTKEFGKKKLPRRGKPALPKNKQRRRLASAKQKSKWNSSREIHRKLLMRLERKSHGGVTGEPPLVVRVVAKGKTTVGAQIQKLQIPGRREATGIEKAQGHLEVVAMPGLEIEQGLEVLPQYRDETKEAMTPGEIWMDVGKKLLLLTTEDGVQREVARPPRLIQEKSRKKDLGINAPGRTPVRMSAETTTDGVDAISVVVRFRPTSKFLFSQE
mmetsp:Transcript_6334/g.13200  ORF Transcript_6334/g.13200 Transcript_6334/m.13200 type:complete len:236 (+) Transcript_6334:369-1076(+)